MLILSILFITKKLSKGSYLCIYNSQRAYNIYEHTVSQNKLDDKNSSYIYKLIISKLCNQLGGVFPKSGQQNKN